MPDAWTPNQVKAALEGVPPSWDRTTEEPIEEPTRDQLDAIRPYADLLRSIAVSHAGHSRRSTVAVGVLVSAGALYEDPGSELAFATALGHRAHELLSRSP